jgi:hypothetical protein
MMGNPSLLANQTVQWRIDVSADVSRNKEIRSYPYYDSFNGVVGYNDYAINDHLYSKLDGGLAWRVPTKIEHVQSLVLSAASYSTYRFDYRYHEEVRNRYSQGGIQDTKLGENRLDITGDLRSITLGAAAKANIPLSVGFSVSLLQGKWDYIRGVYYASPDSANIINQAKYKPNGSPAEFNIGAAYEINDRVLVGGRALVPTGTYKFDQDASFSDRDTTWENKATLSSDYPKHFALGVQYRPQNEFRPSLFLETEIHTYTNVNPVYNNTFEIRAGAEQQVVPGTPVRLGFVYYTAPDNKDKATTLFTAGIGFHLQKLSGDFGIEVGRINSSQPDMFSQAYYNGTDRTDNDHVESSLFRGMITLGWAF